jgi:hypothetical protein
MSFSIEHINPQKYIVNAPPYKYSAEQVNSSVFSVACLEKTFSISVAPAIYTVGMIVRPTYFIGSSLVIDNNQYAPGGSIPCSIDIINYGLLGEKEIFWELINDSEEILSSGSQLSGIIYKWEEKQVAVNGINAPGTYQQFRIRAKITEAGSWLYSAYAYSLPVDLSINSVGRDALNYAPNATIACTINITNAGFAGSQMINWEVVKALDFSVIRSGSQSSGNIPDFGTANVNINGITAPDFNCEFKIRAKVENGGWSYSQSSYCLPLDLTVTSVHPGSDIYWPGTNIDCHVHITNAGFAGSQTIEWQVIKTSDQSVLSSGSQSSGIIGDFASASVTLTGIISPSGGNILFKIRARIQGDAEWIYGMQMGNYMYITPPENPTPRE